MAALLPCPFCGSYTVVVKKEKVDWDEYTEFVLCEDCNCRGPSSWNEAVAQWNTRDEEPGKFEEHGGE